MQPIDFAVTNREMSRINAPRQQSNFCTTESIPFNERKANMKQNKWIKMLAAGAACALAMSTAYGQGAGVSANVGPVGVSAGLSAPGAFVGAPSSDYFMFRGERGEPSRYYYTPQTTIVDETGGTVAWNAVTADTPATVYYEKTGDRMVVKKVVVRRKTNAGGAVKKEETTTTTTTTRP